MLGIGTLSKESGNRKVSVYTEHGFNCVPDDGRHTRAPYIRLGGPAVEGFAGAEMSVIDETELSGWLVKDPNPSAKPGALIIAQDVIVEIPAPGGEGETLHIQGLVAGRLWDLADN